MIITIHLKQRALFKFINNRLITKITVDNIKIILVYMNNRKIITRNVHEII